MSPPQIRNLKLVFENLFLKISNTVLSKEKSYFARSFGHVKVLRIGLILERKATHPEGLVAYLVC